MKPAEIRAMDDDKLSEQVADLLAEWRSLRFQQAVGQLTATARTRQIRKDKAWLKQWKWRYPNRRGRKKSAGS